LEVALTAEVAELLAKVGLHKYSALQRIFLTIHHSSSWPTATDLPSSSKLSDDHAGRQQYKSDSSGLRLHL